VRVDQTDAISRSDVLNENIPQESCLSRTCLPDDVEVMPLVLWQNAKGGCIAPCFAFSEVDEGIAHGLRASFDSGRRPAASFRAGVVPALPSPTGNRVLGRASGVIEAGPETRTICIVSFHLTGVVRFARQVYGRLRRTRIFQPGWLWITNDRLEMWSLKPSFLRALSREAVATRSFA